MKENEIKKDEAIMRQIDAIAQHVIETMSKRVSSGDVDRIRNAYALAREAHKDQRRKSGEPYIMHPVSVAAIVAEEMRLGANPVIAAFLHDVVEDTEHTIDEIEKSFGLDVRFLVSAVTKPEKETYVMTKQLDNFRQMLDTVEFDIRALLVKIADRLHNMRTLQSMETRKQVKIASETDLIYAPFANRLGLYNIKVELENLSLKYRIPLVYNSLRDQMDYYRFDQGERIDLFAGKIRRLLRDKDIKSRVVVNYLRPYSIWRKMQRENTDFSHVQHKHQIRIVYECPSKEEEKTMALRIYSLLTDTFCERPGSMLNYVNTPKENGYKSIHVQLLSDNGGWEQVQITSERMLRHNQLGCIAERKEELVDQWIAKFRKVLKELKSNINRRDFLENVTLSFYNDNITVYSPKNEAFHMSPRATALDYAFMIHTELGLHAKSAHINGQLMPVTTVLKMGDLVYIDKDENHSPERGWEQVVTTEAAVKELRAYFSRLPRPSFERCPGCCPIPGEEVVGFKNKSNGITTVHTRDCMAAIRNATKEGDTIVDVEFEPNPEILYPVSIRIKAVDRYHLLSDIINCITEELKLSIDSLNTTTKDAIVNTTIVFSVHSYDELHSIIAQIRQVPGIEEVGRI